MNSIADALAHGQSWLQRTNALMFIASMLILSYVALVPAAAIFSLAPSLSAGKTGPSLIEDGIAFKIILGVAIIPYIETGIFQWGIMRFLGGKLKLPAIWCVFTSAVLFGLSHSYSYQYMIFGFLFGLVLAYAFVLRDKLGKHSFLCVFAIHALHNFISALFLH